MAIGTLATLPQKFGTALSLYGGGSGSTERYAPNFNGVSQYATHSAVILSGDFYFEFKIKVISFTAFAGIAYDSTGATPSFIRLFNSEDVQFADFANAFVTVPNLGAVDGVYKRVQVQRISNVLSITVDGGAPITANTNGADVSLDTWGRNSGSRSNISVIDLIYSDGSVYNFPMDDGWSNNPTMRNTGTGADGTFINMTEAAWVKING